MLAGDINLEDNSAMVDEFLQDNTSSSSRIISRGGFLVLQLQEEGRQAVVIEQEGHLVGVQAAVGHKGLGNEGEG